MLKNSKRRTTEESPAGSCSPHVVRANWQRSYILPIFFAKLKYLCILPKISDMTDKSHTEKKPDFEIEWRPYHFKIWKFIVYAFVVIFCAFVLLYLLHFAHAIYLIFTTS